MINNAWINGLCVLIINLGSGFVTRDIQLILQNIFEYKMMRWLVFFTICFTTTRDIYISLCMSLILVIAFWHLFNKDSNFCIITDDFDLKYPLRGVKEKIKKYIKMTKETQISKTIEQVHPRYMES